LRIFELIAVISALGFVKILFVLATEECFQFNFDWVLTYSHPKMVREPLFAFLSSLSVSIVCI
jgi:hypothetical protein